MDFGLICVSPCYGPRQTSPRSGRLVPSVGRACSARCRHPALSRDYTLRSLAGDAVELVSGPQLLCRRASRIKLPPALILITSWCLVLVGPIAMMFGRRTVTYRPSDTVRPHPDDSFGSHG